MSHKIIRQASIPKIKVFISVPQSENDAWWFPQPFQVVDKLEDANIVMFTGGHDVTPQLYGHLPHPTTCNSTARDEQDKKVYALANQYNIPKIGICRGAQFLCVMAGGTLIQDQGNHLSKHLVKTFTRKHILIYSDHHQAQYPWQLPSNAWDLLSWTEELHKHHYGWHPQAGLFELINNGAYKYISPIKSPHLPEIEDVYYRNINALAIQSHPEWAKEDQPEDADAFSYYRSLVLRLIYGWDKAAT